MYKLVLIRHGESTWNLENRFTGWADVDLTPTGKWNSDSEKRDKTIAFSLQHHLIIVMKGAPTCIIDGETIYKNTTGNAALATAGTGDVLTGMITSLLAQSYEPVDASIIGVYLHGLTADIALPETGYQSFIASDIIDHIGKAYLSLDK